MAYLRETTKKCNIKSHNLCNMDETGITLLYEHVKVLTKQDALYSRKIYD